MPRHLSRAGAAASTWRHLSRTGEVESRGARPGEGAAVAAEPAQPSVLRPGPSPLPLSRSGEGFAPATNCTNHHRDRRGGIRRMRTDVVVLGAGIVGVSV